MSAKKSKGGKQEWKPGKKVSIGGREYVVVRREDAIKGKPWTIQTADGSRTYHWRAFHGLTLTSGQPLVRPRTRSKEVAAANGSALPTQVTDSALLPIIMEDIVQNPRDGTGEFLAKVLSALGVGRKGPASDGGGNPSPEGSR